MIFNHDFCYYQRADNNYVFKLINGWFSKNGFSMVLTYRVHSANINTGLVWHSTYPLVRGQIDLLRYDPSMYQTKQ